MRTMNQLNCCHSCRDFGKVQMKTTECLCFYCKTCHSDFCQWSSCGRSLSLFVEQANMVYSL